MQSGSIMSFLPGMSGTWLRTTRSFLAGLALVPYPFLSSLYSQPEPSPEAVSSETFDMNLAWDSRYVREGRTVLEDAGIASIAADRSMPLEVGGEWHFSSRYVEGIDADFAELNLSLAYGFSIKEVDLAVGYAWSAFQGHAHEGLIIPDHDQGFSIVPDHEHEFAENEIELEFEFGLLDKVDIASAFIYTPEAGGTFIELVASTDFEKEKWVFTPYVLLGLNRGYIPDEDETFNNLEIGLSATMELFDGMEATFYLANSTGLEDIFWTGVSLSLGKSFLLGRQ